MNVLILSHFPKRVPAGGGPPQEVREFFLSKANVFYIEHPFPYAHDKRSSLTIYEKGIESEIFFTPPKRGPAVIFYILDVFTTWYFLLRSPRLFDLCIALDPLNTFSVLLYRKLGFIKKLVFYTIDYIPQRFQNPLLNKLYHFLDKLGCYHADAIWVLSKRMITARKKNGVDIRKSAPSVLLPMGANLSRIKVLPIAKIDRYQLIFVGYLVEKQGIQIVLETLPSIIKRVPLLKFTIVGDGEYAPTLKNLVRSLHLNEYVKFKGFIKDYATVEKMVYKSAIGIATYVPQNNFAFYTDPGKPKLYLGCGLPVIITDVPEIARIIDKKKAGFMVKYSVKSVRNALIRLLTDDNLYKLYRENATKLSRKYDTDTFIEKAVKNIL